MCVGDLVKYLNMDGELVYGIIRSDVFIHSCETDKYEAIRVLWTDDGTETNERLDTLLDPVEEGIGFA
jgi:hypothetical protein|tara:strand:+ start:2924 stop:3127 length:204 start_codon:yes stop_codon:yes gene_type:complete